MKITRIDHVGVCVANMDAAIPLWLKLLTGLTQASREVVAAHKTEAAFLDGSAPGSASVELISPSGGNEGLEKFLERNKGKAGLHHLAFAVDDLAAALLELDAAGVPLIDKVPRAGARGHMVGFLHPKATDGVLVELVQASSLRHQMMRTLELHTLPPLGELPELMKAVLIRKEREGEPKTSMQMEEVPLPVCGDHGGAGAGHGRGRELQRRVGRAGQAGLGLQDAQGALPHRGLGRVGDRVEGRQGRPSLEGGRRGRHPLQPELRPVPGVQRSRSHGLLRAEDLGLRDELGRLRPVHASVQAQQLVQKPKHLSWEEAASYGLTFFTAYRMLVGQAQVKPGDNVLVWGAAGGLGIFAIQICKVLGANPIAVVELGGQGRARAAHSARR